MYLPFLNCDVAFSSSSSLLTSVMPCPKTPDVNWRGRCRWKRHHHQSINGLTFTKHGYATSHFDAYMVGEKAANPCET